MRRLVALFGAVFAIALIGPAFAEDSVTVQLAPMNNSGITGSAVFTPLGNQTRVVVTVSGEPAGASEPIQLRRGQCGPALGGINYSLTDIHNGTSTTVLNTPFIALWSGGFAIDAQQSATSPANHVVCANLPSMGTSMTTLPKTGGVPTTGAILIAGALFGAGYTLRRQMS